MAEKHYPQHEQHSIPKNETVTSHEVQPSHEHQKQSKELDSIESIRLSIENASKTSEQIETKLEKQDEPEANVPTLVNKDLKDVAFNRVMNRTQRHLKNYERGFSKFIHSTKIDKISELGAKTIARPSGILGGALLALLGSTTLLYMSKHYGFQYNNLVFLLLFVVGFILSVSLEAIFRMVRPKPQ